MSKKILFFIGCIFFSTLNFTYLYADKNNLIPLKKPLLTEKERISQGISPQMVRFSAGIESVEDLKKDLLQSSIKQI